MDFFKREVRPLPELLVPPRPHWYMLVFQYGLGLVVAWQFLEDLALGQWKVYSGEYFPWRQLADPTAWLGPQAYWILAAAEAVLLVLYFARVQVRFATGGLAVILFVDGLASFLNHRLLMAVELLAVSLCPLQRPASPLGYREKHVYWSLDLVRIQLSIVYIVSAIHKLGQDFLSGATIRNIFVMSDYLGMKQYPSGVFDWLTQPEFCRVLAWLTIIAELGIAVALHFRRTGGPALLVGILMHLSFALLMPYIWIFTVQIFFALIAFMPDRTSEGAYRLVYAASGAGPHILPKLVWPGYVQTSVDPEASNWRLECPTGETLTGMQARLQLGSLSPVLFVPAEILRSRPPWQSRS